MQPDSLNNETSTPTITPPETASDASAATGVDAAPVEVATATSSPVASTQRNYIIAGVILLVMGLIAAVGVWYLTMYTGGGMMIGGVEYPAVVAIVNGEDVPVAAFMQSYDQAAAVAVQQGFDPATDESVRQEVVDQAVEVMINTVLMLQQSTAAGFTVTDEQVAAEVAALEEQFGGADQLAAALANAGLSDAVMREDLRDQLIVDQYIKSSPEWAAISVSDEDVRAFYDSVAAASEGLPPFEEVAEEAREQLTLQKQQEATQALIDRVRAESTIEMKI